MNHNSVWIYLWMYLLSSFNMCSEWRNQKIKGFLLTQTLSENLREQYKLIWGDKYASSLFTTCPVWGDWQYRKLFVGNSRWCLDLGFPVWNKALPTICLPFQRVFCPPSNIRAFLPISTSMISLTSLSVKYMGWPRFFPSSLAQIHHQIFIYRLCRGVTHYPWPSARCQMQGGKEWRKRCISHTPQGGTTAVNAAGGTLMVDQGWHFFFMWVSITY